MSVRKLVGRSLAFHYRQFTFVPQRTPMPTINCNPYEFGKPPHKITLPGLGISLRFTVPFEISGGFNESNGVVFFGAPKAEIYPIRLRSFVFPLSVHLNWTRIDSL